jgi:hypothetical protein
MFLVNGMDMGTSSEKVDDEDYLKFSIIWSWREPGF